MGVNPGLWLVRALWAAAIACFAIGRWGGFPVLGDAVVPLVAVYLAGVAMLRRRA